MNKMQLAIVSTICTLILIILSISLTINTIDQNEVDRTLIGGAIALEATTVVQIKALKEEGYDEAITTNNKIQKTVNNINTLINNGLISGFDSNTVKLFARIFNQHNKINVLIDELEGLKIRASERVAFKEMLKNNIKKLIDVSVNISQRAISEDMTKAQIYYVATQESRLRRMIDIIELNGISEEVKNKRIQSLLNDYINVIKKIKTGFNTRQDGRIIDTATRKLIYINEKEADNLKASIQSILENESVFSRIGSIYKDAYKLAVDLSSDTNRLGREIKKSSEHRFLDIELITVLALITLASLIFSIVSWFVVHHENTRLDSQNIKAEKSAYKKLKEELSTVAEGDLTTRIDKSNPHTRTIAKVIGDFLKALSESLMDLKTNIMNAAEAEMKLRADVDEIKNNRKSTLTALKNTIASIADFTSRKSEIKQKLQELPKKVTLQNRMQREIIDNIAKNHDIATSLTKASREVADKFKRQAEKSQKISGLTDSLNSEMKKIQSLCYNLQVVDPDDQEQAIESILSVVSEANSKFKEISNFTPMLIESASDNQTIVEGMREDIDNLNIVARAAKDGAQKLISENESLIENSTSFVESIETLSLKLENINKSADEVVSLVDEGDLRTENALNSVSDLTSSISMVKQYLGRFKIQ